MSTEDSTRNVEIQRGALQQRGSYERSTRQRKDPMMRYLRFLILFFKLLGLSCAASSNESNQTDIALMEAFCRQVFHRPCSLANLPTNNASDCECVPEYQCTNKTTSGSEQIKIDRRFTECGSPGQFCCDRQYINNSISNDTSVIPLLIPPREGCGYRGYSSSQTRITGEHNEAEFAEFPWMVAVLQKFLNHTSTILLFQCGGSIIHPRAVLTSAHNVRNFVARPGDLIVRAGEFNMNSITETLTHQEREVEIIFSHENFHTSQLHNDLAILILKTPFDIVQNVNTICLPQKGEVFDNARCTVTGWGKDNFGQAGKSQSILKKIELPVVPHNICQTRFRDIGWPEILGSSFICAGGEPNADSCTGDGGGPLVCPLQNAPDRWVQAGIVSWGFGCGQNNVPGVYASVSFARRWIDRKMVLYGLETSSYVP